jgi:hypothetical protein
MQARWQACDMPMALYEKYPEFCKFVANSPLIHQIKVTRDRPFEWEGEPAILVEGCTTKWCDLKERFESVYSKRFGEKFIVERATGEVYTYLDDGKGLQKHHPFLSANKVISKLSPEKFETLHNCAQKFIRPEEAFLEEEERRKRNEQRPHVLQIVSSSIDAGSSNVHKLLINPRHPYVRLVAGADDKLLNMQKGDVYEVGYRAKDKIVFPFLKSKDVGRPQFFPFFATQGVFCSPDQAEYVPCDAKVVTSLCVSLDEAHHFYKFTERHHRETVNLGNVIGFHIGSQNCTTFVKKALEAAGVVLPTEMSLTQIIKKCIPDVFSETVKKIRRMAKACFAYVGAAFPGQLRRGVQALVRVVKSVVKKLFDALAALPITLLHLLLGDANGEGGKAFVVNGESAQEIKPGLNNWKKWFSLSNYRFHLPGALQEWQMRQPSTAVFDHPLRLALVKE